MWGTKKKLLRVHESWHVRPLISATRTLQFTQSPADTKMWTSQPQNKMVNKGKLITYPHRQYWGKNLITLYTWWCLLDTSRRCHHANAQLGQAWTTVATEVWAAYPPNFRPLPEPWTEITIFSEEPADLSREVVSDQTNSILVNTKRCI